MTNSVFTAMGIKIVKTVAATALEGTSALGDSIAKVSEDATKKVDNEILKETLNGVSFVGDKLADFSDDAQDWVESINKKDISPREERKAKRAESGSFFAFNDKKNDTIL